MPLRGKESQYWFDQLLDEMILLDEAVENVCFAVDCTFQDVISSNFPLNALFSIA